MRIRLVEDDSLLGKGVAAGLAQAGCAVDWIVYGLDAKAALRTNSYDSIVLDLGLPGIDGLTLLARPQAAKEHTPVIVLTARDTLAERVAGLDAVGGRLSGQAIRAGRTAGPVARTFAPIEGFRRAGFIADHDGYRHSNSLAESVVVPVAVISED